MFNWELGDDVYTQHHGRNNVQPGEGRGGQETGCTQHPTMTKRCDWQGIWVQSLAGEYVSS
jgi:hypothetical protein